MHKEYLNDLRSKITHDLEKGSIKHNKFRMVMLHDSALQSLRAEIIHTLGGNTARGLFKRMGFASGCYDAAIALEEREHLTDMELFSVGSELHSIEGLVVVEPIEMSIDIKKSYISGSFLWKNSYEAEASLKANGIVDEPTCWMQIGYAMGFCSTLVDDFIYFKEVSCIGAGDDVCKIVGKPVADWDESEIDLSDFETHCISDHIDWLQNRLEESSSNEDYLYSLSEIVGDCPLIKDTLKLVDKVAPTDATIMILGETGVGKELIARRIHERSNRSNGPLVSLNCAAIPDSLIESELFGVEKGAYTGASNTRIGKFERAHGGTIFLDEIAELSLSAQAKILRVLQEGELERIGGNKPIKVDVRIIAATHKNLGVLIGDKLFREDLYYRLMKIPVVIPPLRERKRDIELLAYRFNKTYRNLYYKPKAVLTESAIDFLYKYKWPGNIRELKNIVERVVILSNNEPITYDYIKAQIPTLDHEKQINDNIDMPGCVKFLCDRKVSLDNVINEIIKVTLSRNNYNVSKSAKSLGMTRSQLDYRIIKYRIK